METKPWGFYPLGWDVRLLEKIGTQKWNGAKYEGKTIFEIASPGEEILGWMPDKEDYLYPNIGEDEVSSSVGTGGYIKTPHQPGCFICREFATTAPTQLARPPAPVKRFIRDRRTG